LLLFGFEFNLFLLIGEHLSSVLELHLLLFNLALKRADFLIVARHCLLQLQVASFLLQLNISRQGLDTFLNRVECDFLNEDLTVKNIGLLQLLLAHDAEAAQSTVDTHREKLAVVVVKAHTLDLLGVSLHF